MRPEVENWWKQAKKDLVAARNSLKMKDYEWACFQAQQAAEKGLKALFLVRKRVYPISHDLVKIGRELGADEDILRSLRVLSPEYTVARYPNAANAAPYEIYDEEKAKDRIKHAEIVLEWIEKLLRK